MLTNIGPWVKASAPRPIRTTVAVANVGVEERPVDTESGSLPSGERRMTSVRRFVRLTVRLALAAAAVTGAFRMAKLRARSGTGDPGKKPVRTGSFDAWPPVPVAPGRSHPGS
jgi:hypothetical protein